LEHIGLHVDASTQRLTRAYFAAHGNTQGRWHSVDEVDMVMGSPQVYVARGSNASYAHPGTYVRIFGLANDQTRAHGPIWTPQVQVIDERTPWNRFAGRMADNGPRMPQQRAFWRREPTVSVKAWQRWFALWKK